MKAVILAGGKGTRMAGISRDIPKPMLRIGPWPILEHQVSLLQHAGIDDIILIVNFLRDSIIDYFGNGQKWHVHIRYYEESKPLGTVGGIKEIEEWLDEDFLVFYGDVMINMDLERLMHFHYTKKSECTLVLHPNDHPFDSDLVELDLEKRVKAFHPKPHSNNRFYRNLVNAGAYIFNPVILKYLEKGEKADFGRDIFPAIYSKTAMFGYNTSEYLKDMGTPERLKEVEQDYLDGRIERKSYKHKQKAIFLDRDGVINKETSFIHRPEDLHLYDFTAEAIRKINRSDYLSVVVTNQSVIARNLCTIDELENIHNKLETTLGDQRAKLDAIYYCPHHPDKGFPEENPEYKIDCNCRKPKTGMFLDAAGDYNIDLNRSFMIGDTERDILAGRNAGCKTVGVMTGYGLKKTGVLPDFFFKDLNEAVTFITNEPYNGIFEHLAEKNIKTTKKPFIIAIAGNARSGKSNLAAWLKMKFEENQHPTLCVPLDNWIKPEETREAKDNVYERFQIDYIEKDITSLLEGRKITLNTYVNHPERETRSINYQLKGHDILIIEGIVALSSKLIRKAAHAKVFLTISTSLHKKRIMEYYAWRGKKPSDIERLFEKRKADEYQLIEKESKFADFVINNKQI